MRPAPLSPEAMREIAELMLRAGCKLVLIVKDNDDAICAAADHLDAAGVAGLLFDAGEALGRGPEEIGRVTVEVDDG